MALEDLDGKLCFPGMERSRAEIARGLAAAAKGVLALRFLVPPFSVLDARSGLWQTRKRAWLALGIQSEVGRGENLLKMSDTVLEPDPERRAAMQAAKAATAANEAKGYAVNPHLDAAAQRALGAYFTKGAATQRGDEDSASGAGGTSVFDPVLVEFLTTGFSPPSGAILDPFAGGSVRGIVSAKLGRNYLGIDLSARQIAANEEQRAAILAPEEQERVSWVCGDSRECATLAPGPHDMLLSCPPYAFLERYSDDPRDLSTLGYEEFMHAYAAIIKSACSLLREDRFAALVVGDIRAPRTKAGGTHYLNFPADTIAAFRAAGLQLYNYAILVTAVGSLSIRAGNAYAGSRKLGHAHQDVLVFVKGDPFAAAAACGPLEAAEEEADQPEQIAVPEEIAAASMDLPLVEPSIRPSTAAEISDAEKGIAWQIAHESAPGMADGIDPPRMECPRCGREYDDFDGIGVVYCPPPEGCGFCRHIAREDGRCQYCGDQREPHRFENVPSDEEMAALAEAEAASKPPISPAAPPCEPAGFRLTIEGDEEDPF